MPRVSVIVPVYNVEKYLDRCIQSILNQTFEDFELILVDDGSPDNCGKICDEYAEKDTRVTVIHKQNAGVSAARNTGIDKACGEYIMFVDSDDWIEETCLEHMCADLQNHSLVVGGYRTCSKRKNNDFLLPAANYNNEGFADFFISISQGENIVLSTPWAKLYKREIIKDNKIHFDTSLKLSEDTKFNLEFYKHADKALIVEEVIYNYNKDNSSAATKKYFENYYLYRKTTYNQLADWFMEYNKECYLESQIIEVIFTSIFHYITHCNVGTASNKLADIYTTEKDMFDKYSELISARLGNGYTKVLSEQNWTKLIHLWKKRNAKMLLKTKIKSLLKKL